MSDIAAVQSVCYKFLLSVMPGECCDILALRRYTSTRVNSLTFLRTRENYIAVVGCCLEFLIA